MAFENRKKCNKCIHHRPPSLCGWCADGNEFEAKKKIKLSKTITIAGSKYYKVVFNCPNK